MPHQLDVTFELVTPAYAGGADQTQTDGLRPPTLKALLRFWWRTMYHHINSRDLYVKEEQLFGSTRSGQGLRIIPLETPDVQGKEVTKPGAHIKEQGHIYMAYGAIERREYAKDSQGKPLKRPENIIPRIEAGYSRRFRICIPCHLYDQQRNRATLASPAQQLAWRVEIEAALWLLSAFGGFGSRSRRGWGSIMAQGQELTIFPKFGPVEGNSDVTKVLFSGLIAAIILPHLVQKLITSNTEEFSVAEIKSQLDYQVKKFLGGKNVPRFSTLVAEHTVLYPPIRLVWGYEPNKLYTSAYEALLAAAEDFMRYRRSLGWYNNKDPRRHHSTEGVDHRWRDAMEAESIAPQSLTAPHATHFGLPLPGHMSNGVSVDVNADGDGIDRRASPLFFSVLKWGKGSYIPVILYLPGKFLPSNSILKVEVVDPGNKPRVERIRWDMQATDLGDKAISDFFDCLTQTPVPNTNTIDTPAHHWRRIL